MWLGTVALVFSPWLGLGSGNAPGLIFDGLDVGIVRKGNEGAPAAIESFDKAARDVVNPAVQRDAAPSEGQPHRWVGLDIGELGNVFARHGCDLGGLILVLAGFVHDAGRVCVAQPTGHGGHVVEALARRDGGHRAAVGVAADHDVGDLQRRDGILDRGGNAPSRTPIIQSRCGLMKWSWDFLPTRRDTPTIFPSRENSLAMLPATVGLQCRAWPRERAARAAGT